jgi:hypothetical protein
MNLQEPHYRGKPENRSGETSLRRERRIRLVRRRAGREVPSRDENRTTTRNQKLGRLSAWKMYILVMRGRGDREKG